MLGQEILEEKKEIKIDVTPKKAEVVESVATPEQRMQYLYTEMEKVAAEGKDVYSWVKENGKTEDEKMQLWGAYAEQIGAYNGSLKASDAFLSVLSKVYFFIGNVLRAYGRLE